MASGKEVSVMLNLSGYECSDACMLRETGNVGGRVAAADAAWQAARR